NILRGEMNLIGPRPYMLNELEDIDKSNQEIILKVKPGLTGLWQVSGRNELTFKKRVDLDLWYIQNWSLWMDFVIFLKTIKVVLFKVGAR
ncbi:sugar transferase, partial [Sulfurimonas sp. RIFOXYB12_FULL_35_9]